MQTLSRDTNLKAMKGVVFYMCKHIYMSLSSVCVSFITVSISASTQTNTFPGIWYIEHAHALHLACKCVLT